MVDYRLRLRRRGRTTPITQYVLVLSDIDVPTSYHDVDVGQLVCTWSAVRLYELDPAALLPNPTTAALAALTRGTNDQRAAILAAATHVIASNTDPDRCSVLMGAAATLASIVLPRDTITSALKEAHMPVPVRDTPLGRELFEEGREEGRLEARQERDQSVLRLTRLMIRQRFGPDSRLDEIAAHLATLPDDRRLALLETAASLDELTPG
jgi:hypothetical protein